MNPSTSKPELFGCIEAGGTKFVCALSNEKGEILAESRFPTTNPHETLGRVIDFFKNQTEGSLDAVGIGSFGPVDPNPNSATFGYITSTPKPGWAQTDFVGYVRKNLDVPVGFDTDVNAAALGEFTWGAGQGLDTLIYLTIGTGIGGGMMMGGKLLHGLIHPEMGHIYLPHDHDRDPYEGKCPFHKDCFEGLACGPAIMERWGQKAETLAPDHPAWALEAHYIGWALASFTCVLSPQRIIIGGGVMNAPDMFPKVRQEFKQAINGYLRSPEIEERLDGFIVPPGLGNRSGVLGAAVLAKRALQQAA